MDLRRFPNRARAAHGSCRPLPVSFDPPRPARPLEGLKPHHPGRTPVNPPPPAGASRPHTGQACAKQYSGVNSGPDPRSYSRPDWPLDGHPIGGSRPTTALEKPSSHGLLLIDQVLEIEVLLADELKPVGVANKGLPHRRHGRGLGRGLRALDLHAEPRLTKVDSLDSAALVGTENDPRDRSLEIRSLKAAVTIPGSQPSTPSSLGSKTPCEACRPSKLEFQGHAASWENPSRDTRRPAGIAGIVKFGIRPWKDRSNRCPDRGGARHRPRSARPG